MLTNSSVQLCCAFYVAASCAQRLIHWWSPTERLILHKQTHITEIHKAQTDRNTEVDMYGSARGLTSLWLLDGL